ncbi:MAG: aspartate/glutamate racemase family protein [Pseudomonadota bacterium]
MATVTGGKSVYGARLGILMLEARFPRIPGDMGNASTWPFPVQYRIVEGASPDKAVRKDPMALLPDFIDAARDLVRHGCDGLTTNCGFLALMQQELSAAVPVPVATSSLLQIPMMQRMLPAEKTVGVLTISADSLSDQHFHAAGVAEPGQLAIEGVDPTGAFATTILEDKNTMDIDACRADMLAAVDRLVERAPQVGAIVLECTNMVPYAAEISQRTGRPVFSIYTLVHQFYAGLQPRSFSTADVRD